MLFPVCISAMGIFVCMLTSFVATDCKPVRGKEDIESALKLQLIISTFLTVITSIFLAYGLLPAEFELRGVAQASFTATPGSVAVCVCSGCVGGLIIGLVTEYYTSHSYSPVREVALSCKSGGAATCIIYGLALGYLSAIIPVLILSGIVFVSFTLCDTYGVALGAIGMLSTLATGLTIDGYGPVCDNAGGIAEMSEMEEEVRDCTDALDAAGNTTAAIGKGFAIGSAALVSLALYGAFVVRLGIDTGVNVLEPLTFSFLLIGAMLPYWFSALTMKSVGEAAGAMVEEVKDQFANDKRLMLGTAPKDVVARGRDRCIAISTEASLREMVAPSALVMMAPLLAGTFFGVYAVFGLLTGGLVSGVQLAISMSNTVSRPLLLDDLCLPLLTQPVSS
jgi:inorganic pyrophosphatase